MLCVHACAQQRVCVCVCVQVSRYVNSLFLSALPPGIFFSTHLIILCYIQPLACSLFSASFSLQPLHTFHSPPPLFVSVCFFFLLLAVLSCFQPVYSAIALALLFQSQILHHFPFVSDSRRSGYTCKTEVVKCCWARQDQSGLYKQYCLTLCIYVYVKDIPPDHVNEVKMWQLEK